MNADACELFVEEYRRISAGLKKRLLKKPNHQEIVSGYGSLSKKMESEELPEYAALCNIAMAKAEKAMKNVTGEAIAWHIAGKLFLQAEDYLWQLHMPSYKDHLIAGIHCYLVSVEVHVSNYNKPLAVSVCLELAASLMKYNELTEALRFYHKAAELQTDDEEGYFHTLELAVLCRLRLRDYQGVLKDISGITQTIRKKTDPNRQHHILLQKCEVTQMLILLILQPPKTFLSTEYSQLLTRYSVNISKPNYLEPHMNEEVYIILQSMKLAIEQKDEDAKKLLKDDLWPHLTTEQQQLLTVLQQTHCPHTPHSVIT